MDESDLKAIQRLARREHVTTAEWVRRRLAEARERDAVPDMARKLAAIRRAVAYEPAAPAPPIDQMLAEIETGCPVDLP